MTKYEKTSLSILLSTDTAVPQLNALDPISQAEMNLFWNKLQSKIQHSNDIVRKTTTFIIVTFLGLMLLQSLDIVHYLFKFIVVLVLSILCVFQVYHQRKKSKLMVEFVNEENKNEWNKRGFNWVLSSEHGPGDDDPIKLFLELHADPSKIKGAIQKQSEIGILFLVEIALTYT